MQKQNADSYVDVTYNATFAHGNGTITAKLKTQADGWKFVTFRVDSPVFEQDLATLKCSSCGEPHSSNARYCPSCGVELVSRNNTGETDGSPTSTQESATEQRTTARPK